MPSSILKKAQMQMFETIGVLFVFFLLLAFGLIFYAGFQKDNVSNLQSDKTELELVSIAQTIEALTELKCSEQTSITENCYDLLSIEIFSRYMKNTSPGLFLHVGSPNTRIHYLSIFKNSNITVAVFNESSGNFTNYPIYYNDERDEKNKIGRRTNYVPITIKDSRNDEFYFGILYLTVFI